MEQQQVSAATEEARIGMHARILRCPIEENPEDCPLYEVRKWPVEERLAWLDSKSDEAVVKLYVLHIDCLEHKLSKQSSPQS